MKQEKLIQANLDQKLGLWISKFNQSEELYNHILMLDWVLNDGDVRSMEDILKHYNIE